MFMNIPLCRDTLHRVGPLDVLQPAARSTHAHTFVTCTTGTYLAEGASVCLANSDAATGRLLAHEKVDSATFEIGIGDPSLSHRSAQPSALRRPTGSLDSGAHGITDNGLARLPPNACGHSRGR
ncbi:protein of unknown function [Pararobbsia alpina]